MSNAKSSRRDRPRRAEVIADHSQLPSVVDASELFFAWWPSSSFPMPWWPELEETFAELFKRAHQVLTKAGFLVVDDPYNETGDGRAWRLICRPTERLPKGFEPSNFARQSLESQNVKVRAVEAKEGMFHVYLCPPATLEDRLRKAWTKAKNSVPSTEASRTTSREGMDSPAEPKTELGRWAAMCLEEAKRMARFARAGYPENDLRKRFPKLFADVVDKLSPAMRGELLDSARSQRMNVPTLLEYIADVKDLKGPTLYDYIKNSRRVLKDTPPKNTPRSTP